MALKENYKDDILDTSQNVKRKYQMENNGDGTVSFTDVTEYTQQGDSFGSSDLNAMAHAINNISSDAEHTSYDNTESGLISDNVQGAIDEINDNLSGFKFYPSGTGIVGLISDDSAYTDEDGNYVVWGTETAEQLVEDNPNTYKSVPSTEDARGKVGADTGTPFSGKVKYAHGTKFGTHNIGFRPLQIFALSSAIGSSTAKNVEALYYDQNYSSNKITVYGSYDSRTENGSIIRSNNASSPYMRITNINDNGFTITSSATWSESCVWSAFGIEE